MTCKRIKHKNNKKGKELKKEYKYIYATGKEQSVKVELQ